MKLELIDGCMASSFTVDNKEVYKLSSEELLSYCTKVVNTIKNKDTLLNEFKECLTIIGDYDLSTDYYTIELEETIKLVYLESPYTREYKEYLTANDLNLETYNINIIKKYFIQLLQKATEYQLYDCLRQLTEDIGIMKFLYHCDECGDNIYSYTIKL